MSINTLKLKSTLKGGEMMRIICLVLGLVFVMGGAAVAETVSYDTYAGWNLVSFPCVPYNPEPSAVLSAFDMMFTGIIQRHDAPTQSAVTYDAFAPAPTEFGNILLGEGYWLYYPDAGSVSYSGVTDGVPDLNGPTDMWISLPGSADPAIEGGWHIIGHPFSHDTPIDPNFDWSGSGISFTDGTELKTWSEAVIAGWVGDSAYYTDTTSGVQYTAGYFFNDDDHLRANVGYYVVTMKDNLAMIIPAQ